MMMHTLTFAGRIGRVKLLAAVVVGLFGLTLGGCAGSNSALLDANRSLQDQNTKLTQDRQSLQTLNQQLQDALAARDKAIAELQAGMSEGDARRAALAAKFDELNGKLPTSFGNIALDSATDAALRELAAQHADLLEYDAARGLIRFKSDLLFDSGKDELSSNARSTIQQFAQILNTTAAGYDVRIIGHTDTQPIRHTASKYPSNWHLSCYRSISVLRELITNGFPPDRGEAAGRGEFDPLVPNNANGNTPQNRRVEVYMTKQFRSAGMNTTPVSTSTPKAKPAKSGGTKSNAEDFMK